MRFAIHTLGTRGDMQPYLAVARGLRGRGHEVLVVAPAQFAALAQAEGIGFAALPGAFLDLLDSQEAKEAIGKSGAGFGAGFKLLKHYRALMGELLDAEWAAASEFGPDAILYHPKALGRRILRPDWRRRGCWPLPCPASRQPQPSPRRSCHLAIWGHSTGRAMH